MATLSEATHDLLLEDLHEDLLTPGEASLIYRIPLATLRQWKRRGHLTPAATDHLSRPLLAAAEPGWLLRRRDRCRYQWAEATEDARVQA